MYLQVLENVREYLLLRDPKFWVIIIRVRTDMNYSVHIQVEVVKLWDLKGMKAGEEKGLNT